MVGSTERGFSLVEILVGLGILLTVLVVAAGLLPVSRLMDARSAGLAVACDLATKQMDGLRCTPFTSLASSSVTTTVGGTDFAVQTTVTPCAAPSPTSMVSATVVVSWRDQVPRSIRLDTLLTRVDRSR